MAYILSCCSTVDLTPEHMKARDLHYISFHYQMDDAVLLDDMGLSIDSDSFYQAMVDGADTRTSQVNAEEYEAAFEPYLRQGLDVLHLCLSSGISGTINSAQVAKMRLEEKYPERKVNIVDSLAASSGFGLLMDELADRRDAGMSLEELTAWAESHKKLVNHWFFSTDLTFYIKGGRVSKTAGFFGQMLNICPLLNVDNEGRLIPREKVRGKKKVIREIVNRMVEHAPADYSGRCYISHSACYDDARAVADLVEEHFPLLKGKVEIFNIGATIGSHTGPGTVALFFLGDERVN